MLYAFVYQYTDGPTYLYGASDFQEAYYYWAQECPNEAAQVSGISDNDAGKHDIKFINFGNLCIRVKEFEFNAGAIGSYIY